MSYQQLQFGGLMWTDSWLTWKLHHRGGLWRGNEISIVVGWKWYARRNAAMLSSHEQLSLLTTGQPCWNRLRDCACRPRENFVTKAEQAMHCLLAICMNFTHKTHTIGKYFKLVSETILCNILEHGNDPFCQYDLCISIRFVHAVGLMAHTCAFIHFFVILGLASVQFSRNV